MILIPSRRWYLEKYDPFTQKLIPVRPPEPLRFFWLRSTAFQECDRLNRSLRAAQMTPRYRLRYMERR